MVAFGHTAAGTITGVIIYEVMGSGDPILGLLSAGTAGLVSHYLGDLMPHGHFFKNDGLRQNLGKIIFLDLLLPIVLVLGIAVLDERPMLEILYILFGIGGAQLPDVVASLKSLGVIPDLKILRIEGDFHSSMHWHGHGKNALTFTIGDIWQIMLFGLALLTIIRL